MGILLVVNGNCVFNFLQWAEERKVKVFQKGERVVCGSKGVCVVEEITTLDIAGVDKKREYYILKPLYLSSSTVYIPVDTAEGSMRKVLAHEEAEKLSHRIPEIPLITIANDKPLEQEYKNCLKTSSCQDLIRIIKTIYLRKRAREEAGRKETPKILLCDEATSALDPTTTKEILKLLQDINKQYGITIEIITHEMAVVQEICSHVAIIDAGELAEHGTVEEVFSRPQSAAARKLVFMVDPKAKEMSGKRCIRIVFTENSSFEPVIANMVLECKAPVNILLADTKDIGGIAHGQMILQLPEDEMAANKMIHYLQERKLEVEELKDYVG